MQLTRGHHVTPESKDALATKILQPNSKDINIIWKGGVENMIIKHWLIDYMSGKEIIVN